MALHTLIPVFSVLSHLHAHFSNTPYSMPICCTHLSSPASKPLNAWGPLPRTFSLPPLPATSYNSFLCSKTRILLEFLSSHLPSHFRLTPLPHHPITFPASPMSENLLESSVLWNLCLSFRWVPVSSKR